MAKLAQKISEPNFVRRQDMVRALAHMRQQFVRREWADHIIPTLSPVLEDAKSRIEEQFYRDRLGGLDAARRLSQMADGAIRTLYDFISEALYPNPNPTESERITILAIGGYGRSELAPYSDLDLMFLIPYKPTPWLEQVIEKLLYSLWDLGFKVGHSVRTIEDADRLARQDLSVMTSLIEARFIWGDQAQAQALMYHIRKNLIGKAATPFVEDKLKERDERHTRFGDSRFMVEPNLKNGKGGLRDIQTLWWIIRYVAGGLDPDQIVSDGWFNKSEYRQLIKYEKHLWTIRFALHYLAGRMEDRLAFEYQRSMAEELGYKSRPGSKAVERFMKHYFFVAKGVGDLTRVFCAVLEERQHKKTLRERFRLPRRVQGFKLIGDRLAFRSSMKLDQNPSAMVEIFAVAEAHSLDIHPEALRQIQQHSHSIGDRVRRDPKASAAFMDVLLSNNSKTNTLRRMNESGVFGRFMPEFGRVVGQMQYDMYHHYTVDEHTIQALILLKRIERGELETDHPLASQIIHKILSRRALYLAVLLHDIAKGRPGDHSEIGAHMAREVCPRLGLKPSEVETVAWLVRWHLFMSDTAFKRDVHDPQTVENFCAHVQSAERLRLLLVLTVVDIRAVGPGVWNGWKGQLLRELYQGAQDILVLGHASQNREKRIAGRKAWFKKEMGLDDDTNESFLIRWRDAYWIGEDDDTICANYLQTKAADEADDNPSIQIRTDTFQAITKVGIYTNDSRGLVMRLVAGLSRAGVSIRDAKIHTAKDGMAMDNFALQTPDGEVISEPADLIRLEESIRRALSERTINRSAITHRRHMAQRPDLFDVDPYVLIDNKASGQYTVIEVAALDRPGLLFDLAHALFRLDLNISSAHITTYGERAVDTFYVKNKDGSKANHPQRMINIEKKLCAATKGQKDKQAGSKRPVGNQP